MRNHSRRRTPAGGLRAAAATATATATAWVLAAATPAFSTPTSWRVMPAPPLHRTGAAALTGISCTTGSFCMAVGTVQSGSGLLAEAFDGRRWRTVSPPGNGKRSVLASVSCRSARWCVAVGYSIIPPDAKEPLAEFWNGRSWRAQLIPVPAGLGPGGWSLLEGVSCPTVTRCYAVGQLGPAQPNQELDLFATWSKGQGWTHTSLNESQSIVLNLSGVSCSSLNACFAVGQSNWKGASATSEEDLYYAYQDVNGTDQWAGTNTNGTYDGVGLNAVSCVANLQCMAVGPVTAGTSQSDLLTSIGFTLTTGTRHSVGVPKGATAAGLNGIACRTASSCTSVGDAEVSHHVSPLVEQWNGQRWTIERSDGPPAYAAVLAAVSCPSPKECIAVGDQARTAKSKPELLIERGT